MELRRCHALPFLILSFLAVATPWPAHGQGSVDWQAPVDMPGAGDAVDTIDLAADTGFLVVWAEQPTVLVRELDSAGQAIGLPRAVTDILYFEAPRVDIAAGASEFVVAWQDPSSIYNEFGRPEEVLARRYDGATASGETRVVQSDRSGVGLSDAAMLPDGNFLIVWEWCDCTSSPVFGYRGEGFDATDSFIGSFADSQVSFGQAIARDGEFVVAEGDYFPGGSSIQRFQADGTELGSAVQLTTQGGRALALARAPADGLVTVWRNRAFADHQITGQRLDDLLVPVGANFQINSTTGVDGDPSIVSGPDNGLLITWQRQGAGSPVVARYLRPDGVLEDELEMVAATAIDPGMPEIAIDRFGGVVAAWTEDGGAKIRRGSIDRGLPIDEFATPQAALALSAPGDVGNSTGSIAAGLDLLGGERDLVLELVAGTSGNASVEVAGGELRHVQDTGVTAVSTTVWDQADGSPTSLDSTGLPAPDLGSGGTRDAVVVEVVSADAGASLELGLEDGLGSSTYTLDLPSGASSQSFVIPFADFSAGADPTAIGAVSLEIDGSGTPGLDVTIARVGTTARIAGTLEVMDLDGGMAEPGDVLEYTAVITNPSDALAINAPSIDFTGTAPAGTELLCMAPDAPTTSQGSIDTCDPSAGGSLSVALGDLADGAMATVTYRARVLDTARSEACSFGLLSSPTLTDLPTDDPGTASTPDATCMALAAPAAIAIGKTFELLTDADADSQPSVGDTLDLTVLVSHAGGDRDAKNLVLHESSAAGLLIVGSVTTDRGTITSGNGMGDTSVVIDLGDLASGEQAEIGFQLVIDSMPAYQPNFRCATEVEGDGSWARELLEIPMPGLPVIQLEQRDLLVNDVDGNGHAGPGDRLRYEIELTNSGDWDLPPTQLYGGDIDGTGLVVGSVVTDTGTIVEGNTPGDSEVRIDFGALEGLGVGTASVRFEVVIDDPLAPEIGVIRADSSLGGLGGFRPSDDPDTPDPNDDTLTPIVIAPAATANLANTLIFDANSDGIAQTGDIVGYTLDISHTGTGSLAELVGSLAIDPSLRPICGGTHAPASGAATVTTCQNAPGGGLEVAFDLIVEGGDAQLTFAAEVLDNAPPAAVCAQVDLDAILLDLLSDDGDLPGAEDPTCRAAGPSSHLIFYDGFESGDAGAWDFSS